jgi:hypothetical protein
VLSIRLVFSTSSKKKGEDGKERVIGTRMANDANADIPTGSNGIFFFSSFVDNKKK